MFPWQFLLIPLAVSTISVVAQTPTPAPTKPKVLSPPFSTVEPLEIGPAEDPRDQIELSPLPLEYDVEHPLLVSVTVFKVEPLPRDQVRGHDPSSLRFYTAITRVSTDGTVGKGAWWGYSGIDGSGFGPTDATPIPADSFARIRVLVATLPDGHGCVPPRNHKVQVEVATSDGTKERMYDAANLPEALLEILRLTHSDFTPIPK